MRMSVTLLLTAALGAALAGCACTARADGQAVKADAVVEASASDAAQVSDAKLDAIIEARMAQQPPVKWRWKTAEDDIEEIRSRSVSPNMGHYLYWFERILSDRSRLTSGAVLKVANGLYNKENHDRIDGYTVDEFPYYAYVNTGTIPVTDAEAREIFLVIWRLRTATSVPDSDMESLRRLFHIGADNGTQEAR